MRYERNAELSIILIGFISSCSTKRDKPIQEGNLETIRFDENQVRELPMQNYEAGTYDIAVIGAGQGPREAGTRPWARTSVFASGENLAAGAIHLPRGCKITLGSRVARRIR